MTPDHPATAAPAAVTRPRFMLRVAGLPLDSVRGLRCPDSRRWADDVLRATEQLRADGERLADLLHDLVGGSEDETLRRTLLALRRDIFNNRLPRPGAADHALGLVRGLDAAAGTRAGEALTSWLAGRRRLEERRAAGAALLAEETARARAHLRTLAGEERLRRALPLASPDLDARLDTYVRSDAAVPPDKKQRKIERSLLSYLYRTACKTSPFSTFTGVALGTFSDGDQGLRARVDDTWDGRLRLNVAAIGRLTEAVVADPVRRADLPVAPASGWGRDDDRVRYVRRWITQGEEDTAVTFDAVKDRLFFLRRSGTLERLLGLFEERTTLRYGELADWLAEDRGADPQECAQYLRALLDIGMVQVPCLRTEVHDTDPLRALQDSLRGLGRPWADRLAGRLADPASGIEAFAGADPAGRRALMGELRTSLRLLQEEELGVDGARVPQTLLYEDVAAGRHTELSAAAWERLAAAPLGAVERVLPAFDLTLPQRITFKGFFLARYGQRGRCDDLLKLVHDFHEDFFDQYMSFTAKRTTFDADGTYVPEENWLALPQLKALDTARRTFVERMRALWADWEADPGSGDEIQVDGELLDEVAAGLDTLRGGFAPLAHHVQIADRPGDPLVVLNRSYGGVSFPFSRFTHLFDGLDEQLLAATAELLPAGAVLAEVTGGPVTSNLNLHGRLTEYEIVCPGERGTLPEANRIHLDDLHLVHDPDADRLVLRSTRLGKEVVPVYLGYLVPLALPELPRTLLLLSPTSMSPLNVWGGVPEGAAADGVTGRPRVRHGSVVLDRRSWSAPAAVLPLRAPGCADDAWFLGWQAFRRAHGLPDRVFATIADSGARGATGAKPTYVDFDSPLSLGAFEALIRTAGARVVFREMLPDENGLHTVSGRGHHVAELAVETATPVERTDPS
ncbi:lantibiotic dehydratase [Streptomyces sp. NBC_00893]|uniref:lantibiotic dehydratase n=1 Tax=Streptomyces sp. NBC_00893 TaxID=2975862 RepID=UPI002254C0AE|nr:lantibiotic dehydratase [Streptomyces sp. NBC_00893]MCX4847523.1 lantibiotic dehydratase family protein [Streptomyces sp. NBC_00893]